MRYYVVLRLSSASMDTTKEVPATYRIFSVNALSIGHAQKKVNKYTCLTQSNFAIYTERSIPVLLTNKTFPLIRIK